VSDASGPTHVVATAGHVDHGKSTLIRRLTGIDPDRLEEEKRRGLTIDLGFAWCTLPSGREIGFVDVPGHERFVRTMLAGVGPVRLVLFVVAADEGWKPQSEEHLAIVDVLGVDGAVIALTKSDAVDGTRLLDVEADVRSRVEGTPLADAAVVACSAISGHGVDGLLEALDAMVASAPEPEDVGRPRLFVDRVFTIAGAGTVVTGTLTGGRLAIGDEVEAVPGGARGRIRGLETHRRRREQARPVSRVAVNLAGARRRDVVRGDVLGHPGDWVATATLEARITPIRGLRRPIGARGAYALHAGSAEREAALRIYPADDTEGGAFVRIRLSRPLALDVFDRFVLRESGRRATVAGGVVLDPTPPERPGREPGTRLEKRASATRQELPALLVAERGVASAAEIDRLAGATVESIVGARRVGRWWVHGDVLEEVEGRIVDSLRSAERDGSPDGDVSTAVAAREIAGALRRSRIAVPAGLAEALLEHAVEDGRLARAGTIMTLPGARSQIADGDVRRLVEAVAEGEPTPPSIPELHARGAPISALQSAIASGDLIRLAPDLVVTSALVRRALEVVRAAGAAGATVSAVRQELGTSRKYAVPLMEHLDRTGATRREGDVRIARGS
jgi:selenocysteine-specific elongation factor